MILTKEICARLVMAIQKKGTTPYKIAKALNISASTIGNYLSGKVTKADYTKMTAICTFLGINIYWLETGEDMVIEDQDQKGTDSLAEDTAYQIKQIFLKLQARDDQFLNLHKDMGYIRRNIENLNKEVSILREEVKKLK